MKIGELKKLIKKLPNDMDVFMDLPDDVIITACFLKSQVEEINIPKEEFEDIPIGEIEDYQMEQKEIFLLRPCSCEHDIESPIITKNPKLN